MKLVKLQEHETAVSLHLPLEEHSTFVAVMPLGKVSPALQITSVTLSGATVMMSLAFVPLHVTSQFCALYLNLHFIYNCGIKLCLISKKF